MDDQTRNGIGERAAGLGERVKGEIKEAAGDLTGNASLKAEGARESAAGEARQQSYQMITGLFRHRESAERALNSLVNRGYTKDDVNILMSNETRDLYYPSSVGKEPEADNKTLEGIGLGSAFGGAAGAILGAIAALGTSVALPGLSLVAVGPLAAALIGIGASTGGVTGGFLGALVGNGIPEERVRDYEIGLRGGGILLGVTPRSEEDASYIASEFRAHGGEQI